MATHTIAEVPQALADEVTSQAVMSLLLSRAPDFITIDDPQHELLTETALGVAREVAPYAGLSTDTQRWILAVRAVGLGSALAIEAALYPLEASLDQTGLSLSLEARYRAVMDQLGGQFSDDPAGQREPGSPPAPRGKFPPAPCYPDPARW